MYAICECYGIKQSRRALKLRGHSSGYWSVNDHSPNGRWSQHRLSDVLGSHRRGVFARNEDVRMQICDFAFRRGEVVQALRSS